MARNLLWLRPIETVMPISRSTCALEAGKHQRRRRAVQPLGAGQVEERLVDRERLDRRRQRQHQLAHLARRRAAYFAMSGGITTACGQAFSALNIGMAERTPKVRAT